jgi:hypothetical protein
MAQGRHERVRLEGLLLLSLVGLALVGGPHPAQAKGAYLELDRRYYAPGNVAIAKTEVFDESDGLGGKGPFFAYLGKRDPARSPQRVPDDSIPLGSVEVYDPKPSDEKVILRVRFSIPDVPPAWYWVRFFDSRGRATAFGEGLLRVVQTNDQAAGKEVSFWEGRVSRIHRHMAVAVNRLRERNEELRARLFSELFPEEPPSKAGHFSEVFPERPPSTSVDATPPPPEGDQATRAGIGSTVGWAFGGAALTALLVVLFRRSHAH